METTVEMFSTERRAFYQERRPEREKTKAWALRNQLTDLDSPTTWLWSLW